MSKLFAAKSDWPLPFRFAVLNSRSPDPFWRLFRKESLEMSNFFSFLKNINNAEGAKIALERMYNK